MPNIDVVHTRMRTARERAGMTLDDMAAALGLSKSYAREMETINDPGVWKHIVNWAEQTGTTTDYLLDAAWARNEERIQGSEYTPEALEAMRLMDALPEAARLFLLSAIKEYVSLLAALVTSQSQLTRLLILLAELNIETKQLEAVAVSPATVDQALQDLLSRLRK